MKGKAETKQSPHEIRIERESPIARGLVGHLLPACGLLLWDGREKREERETERDVVMLASFLIFFPFLAFPLSSSPSLYLLFFPPFNSILVACCLVSACGDPLIGVGSTPSFIWPIDTTRSWRPSPPIPFPK